MNIIWVQGKNWSADNSSSSFLELNNSYTWSRFLHMLSPNSEILLKLGMQMTIIYLFQLISRLVSGLIK